MKPEFVDIRILRNRILGDYCLEFRLIRQKIWATFCIFGPKRCYIERKKNNLDSR